MLILSCLAPLALAPCLPALAAVTDTLQESGQGLPTMTQGVEQRAAAIRGQLRIDRDLIRARREAEALWAHVSKLDAQIVQGDRKAPANFDRAASARAALLVLVEVAIEQGDVDFAQSKLQGGVRAIAALGSDPEVQAWNARMAKMQPATDEIDALVREMARTDMGRVAQIGMRAAPTLRALCMEDREGLPSLEQDPLTILVQVDRTGSVGFLIDSLEGSGPIWRTRMLRAMEHVNLLTKSSSPAWKETSRKELTPEGATLVTGLFAYPDSRDKTISELDEWARVSGAPVSVAERLHEFLKEGRHEQGILRILSSTRFANPNLRPLVITALGSRDAGVQEKAGQILVRRYEDVSELQAMVDHPSPAVRSLVLGSLYQRQVTSADAFSQGYSNNLEIEPALDTKVRLLAKLVADPSPSIRTKAIEFAVEQADPLGEDLVSDIARSPDQRDREHIVRACHGLSADEAAAVLELGLADPSAKVRAEAVDRIQGWISSGQGSERFLRMAPLALREAGDEAFEALVKYLLQRNPEGSKILVDHVLDHDQAARLFSSAARRGDSSRREMIRQLTNDQAVRWLPEAWNAAPDTTRSFLVEFDTRDHPWAPSLITLATDARYPLELRVLCGSLAVQTDRGASLCTTLSAPGWAGEWLDSKLVRNGFSQMSSSLAESSLVALEAQAADERLLAWLGAYTEYRQEDTAPLARRITERWIDDWNIPDSSAGTMRNRSVSKALLALGRFPDAGNTSILARALDQTTFRDEALAAIRGLRDPEHLELIRERLPVFASNAAIWGSMVETTGRFLSDGAIEVLLEAAGIAGSGETRDAALAQVEAIRTYQDALDRWQRRKHQLADRTAAVTQLLELLDDKEPALRREAVRGLATLDAVEALPRLVTMLRDEDEGVRKAVQAALDHLNRPAKPEKQ